MDTTYKNDRTNLEKLFESGCNYYEAGDKAKALNIWKEAAELGYPKAQHFVAVCYHSGIGTEKDKTKALEWYRKAAAQNHPQSVCYLAKFYAEGIAGVERNTDEAIRLWKKAAELGDKEAKFILGNTYYYGTYVEQDREEAIRWYRKSAQQLFLRAINRMHELGEWIFDPNETDAWFGTTLFEHPVILLPQS